jgi:hypothetical protein
MPIPFEDLLWGLQFISVDPAGANEAYVNRTTGELRCRSDLEMLEPDLLLPGDADPDAWTALPTPRELGLGTPAVMEFVSTHMPSDNDEIRNIFGRKGAYGRFKALLTQRGLLEQWHAFHDAAEKAALRAWCEEEGLDVSG